MTIDNYDVSALKSKVFAVTDELHTLYSSYEALQVIASGNSGDSSHVGAVICGLNYRFEALLLELEKLYQKREKSQLHIIDGKRDTRT